MMKLKNIKIGRIKENVNVALEIDQRLTTVKQQGGGRYEAARCSWAYVRNLGAGAMGSAQKEKLKE